MKINIIDEYNTVIYLNKSIIKFIDFSNVENELDKIFLKLKNTYNISISGYYDVDIYCDDNYGVVIKLTQSDIDSFDYLDKIISMNINTYNKEFLYKLDDIYDDLKSFIYYKSNIYTNNYNDIRISEHASIIYDDLIDKINNEGLKIIL